MLAATSDRDLGVYVHVPFCEHVCPYCDFAVEGVGKLGGLGAAREARYVELLLRELDLARAAHPEIEGIPLASVYFGGGTPSLLAAGSIERILERLRQVFRGEPAEVTLELNPGLEEYRRASEFRAAGVSRLSLGLQSLQDEVLKRLGRAQTASEARRGLEACLAAGFASLSADLIYGAPEQQVEALLADLEELIALDVAHVSAYALTLEPGTPFARAHARGRLPLPPEEAVVDMNVRLRARLAGAGYLHYEISSFALPGHASRHNQRYWLRQDVLGLGVSAASKLGDLRFQNVREPPRWEAGVQAGERPLAESERIDAEAARRETLYLGFRRLEGVSRARFESSFGAPPERWFAAELAELLGLDLILEQDGHLRLTERGILFADEVFLRFVGR